MLFLFISSWSLLIKCAKGGRNKYDLSTSSLQYCATKISKVGQLKKTEVKPTTRKLKRNYRNTKQCLLPPRDWAPVIKSSTPDFTPKTSYKIFVRSSFTDRIPKFFSLVISGGYLTASRQNLKKSITKTFWTKK